MRRKSRKRSASDFDKKNTTINTRQWWRSQINRYPASIISPTQNSWERKSWRLKTNMGTKDIFTKSINSMRVKNTIMMTQVRSSLEIHMAKTSFSTWKTTWYLKSTKMRIKALKQLKIKKKTAKRRLAILCKIQLIKNLIARTIQINNPLNRLWIMIKRP